MSKAYVTYRVRDSLAATCKSTCSPAVQTHRWPQSRCRTWRESNSGEGGEVTLKGLREQRGRSNRGDGERKREKEPQGPGSWCNYRAANTQREERGRRDKKSWRSWRLGLHLLSASVQPSAPVCQLDKLSWKVSHFT